MKIMEMTNDEKPRERFLEYGVESLSNVDLISIILRCGTKDLNVKEVASNILKEANGINNLSKMGIRELSNIKGLGTVKAITLLSAIELGKRASNKEIVLKMKLDNPKTIHDSFKKDFKNMNKEKLLGIFLDNSKRLITYKTLSLGTINKTIIDPRDIFKEALSNGASSLVLIHNHPSGDLSPSNEDIKVTEDVRKCGILLNIPLLDHIITNGENYMSFYENKL